VSKDAVRDKVQQLLREGFFGEERAPGLRVGEPIAVLDPQGRRHSWYVPLQVGPKLVGFAQLLPSLEPMGVSRFAHRLPDFADYPDLADWTDPARIRELAMAAARPDERLSEPVLSFDQNPSRLAWRVEAVSPTGAKRTLFVAGTTVYEATGASGLF